MGIFEKSIPKYVVHPLQQNVQVVPQEYVVDDIFDPILNARVRDALRQKYGGGLYGLAGGYSELLQNAWGGDKGILGKGMGVLSTFGRSMEKADDIVLGFLTEGVEGITGQGFDDPLKQIFSEDVDYSGKRLLASTANTFRNVVGTSITEDGLGTEWNIPALGIDLATDVGILGGGIARKFAPAAKGLTSKELFQRLGKSDLKTTVGEIGQLMSNYDDLMAKVAIDITAPGLRPGFKLLKNKLGNWFATHSSDEYAEFVKLMDIVEDESADPTVRKQARKKLANNKVYSQMSALFNEADSKLANTPETADDIRATDAIPDTDVDRAVSDLQRDIDAEVFAKREYSKKMDSFKERISKSRLNYNRRLYKKFAEAIKIAESYGYRTDYNKLLELRDPVKEQLTVSQAIPALEKLLDDTSRDGLNKEYSEPIRQLVEDAKAGKRSGLMEALYTGAWSDNDATNKQIMRTLEQYVPFVKQYSTPYRVSPSLRSAVKASGAPGVSYAYAALKRIVTQDVKSGKRLFNTPEELDTFLQSPRAAKALEDFIPPRKLSPRDTVGLTAEQISEKELKYALGNRKRFANLLKKVYFPEEGVSLYEYTRSLIALEDFVARNATPIVSDPNYKFLDTLTKNELAEYAKNPEKALSLKHFLESKGLLTYREGASGYTDPAVQYLLTGELPKAIKYPGKNDKLRKGVLARASRLRSAYRSELQKLSGAISAKKKRSNSFFNKLYDTVDDISMTYLQPLRDETPHHLKGVDSLTVLDKKIGSDSNLTFADTLKDEAPAVGNAVAAHRTKNRWDDENALAISRTIRDWIRTTIPADADIKKFTAITRPLADYVDIGYKAGADVPIRPKVAKDVSTFYNEVVPVVERILSNSRYGNYYIGQVFTTDDRYLKGIAKKDPAAAEDIKKLRNLLGAPLAESAHSKSEVFKELYNKVIKVHKTSDLVFKSKHSGNAVNELTKFFSAPKTPAELFEFMTPKFNKAHYEGSTASQNVRNLNELADRFYENVYKTLDDLGTTEDEITTIIQKTRTDGIATLTPEQLRLYRTYTQEISKTLSQTPYRVYARTAAHWGPETSWSGISSVVSSKYPFKPDAHGGRTMSSTQARTEELITRELAQSLDSTRKIPYEYSDDDLNFVSTYIVPHLPNNVKGYWKPSKQQGLFYFDLPKNDEAYTFQLGMDVDLRPERFQIYRFLKDFKGDIRKLKDMRTLDYSALYTKSGFKNLSESAARLDLRMNLIPDKPAALTDVYSDAFSRYTPTTRKTVSTSTDAVKQAIIEEAPEAVAKEAYEPTSVAQTAVDKVTDELTGDVDKFLNDGGSPEAAETVFGKRKWSLYKQIQEASALKTKNALRKDRATLRTKITTALGKAFEAVTGKAKSGDFKRYYQLRAKMLGDTVSGADFWTTFRRSGILASAYAKGSDMIEPTYEALTKNAKIINDLAGGKELVEVVKYTLDNDNVAVVMRWKGDKATLKYVKNLQKKLDSAKFNDVVFTKATALTTEEQAFMNSEVMRELSGLMDQLQTVAADQARYLGFKFDNATPYTKHAMRHDPFSAAWINRNFYAKGMDSQGYDDISSLISDLDGYRQMDRGTFGTALQERRFRGDYWLLDDKMHPMFEYTPDKVFTSTLADGIFANLQYQTFTDLFVNDNFKIKDWFTSVDDLKKVLYAKLPNGKVSGNLQNLELVSFKTDANGKITGLIKHDKMSDTGLQKALADENTILVPANVISHMDNILRKDVRMSNKFWTFINKHFTIPFKFGLLSNPGFLLGNVSDSILKITTTMHQKYGTTMAEEAANAADSIASVINLKNIYYEAFKDWKLAIAEHNIKVADEAKIPDIVAMSPKYKDMFLKYLDGTLEIPKSDPVSGKPVMEPVYNNLSKEQIDGARVWMMLQGMQMNTSKLREYADIAELNRTSEFDVPTNVVDRVIKGKGNFRWTKPKTWGLFMNNPVMKAFTDASGSWEELIRTASILDDLKHKRYTLEQMSEYSKYVSPDLDESRRLFDVHLEEAKSTMYSAQFDYERVNDFINKVGKSIPFPIFFLKNFQYWMELFMENPQYVDTAIDIQEGLWSGYNEDNDKFMTEAKGRGAIPVGGKALPKWFKGVYKPSPLQSMFGAFNLLNSPVDNLTYRVNPLMSGAKTAAVSLLPPDSELTTLLSDPESVKYRPYSTDMYERNVKQGDKNFSPVKYTLHRMNPYDRAINAQLRLPAKVSEGDAQLADVFPSVFQPMF